MSVGSALRAHPAASPGLVGDLALASASAALAILMLVLAFAEHAPLDESSLRPLGALEAGFGDVRRRPHDTLVWRAIAVGQPVHEGDMVFAAASSEGVVKLEDGSTIRVGENSLISLRSVQKQADRRGPVTVEVERGAAEIEVSSARLALLVAQNDLSASPGTRVAIRVSSDRKAQLDVARGAVAVESGAFRTEITEGHRRSVGPGVGVVGEASAVTVWLTEPAQGSRLFFSGNPPEHQFAWTAPSGEGAFSFELARDPGFQTLFVTVTTPLSTVARALPEGTYYWRIRRALPSGAEQLSEEWRFTLVRDDPPWMLMPRERADALVTDDSSLVIQWATVPGVRTWAVELANGPTFSQVTQRARVTALQWVVPERPDEGSACVRVRAVLDDEQRVLPWSEPRCFTVLHSQRLRAPSLLDPSLEREPEEQR